MKPLLVTSGEPAGVGPDICLALADCELPIVVMADKALLASRAELLHQSVTLIDYEKDKPVSIEKGQITVLSCMTAMSVIPGKIDKVHAPYVMQMLTEACQRVLDDEFSALVTAPVHKGILNAAGFSFSGHTEFLKDQCAASDVVMLLASPLMKVALVTTHVPLAKVPELITQSLLQTVIVTLLDTFNRDFGIKRPKIAVAGLNPHAGESGYLGHEEQEIISPVITDFQCRGIKIDGPFSADTLFSEENLAYYDVFLSMYHDQGLPVIKYADFKRAVNITLGLPIIRTSVDHGTALTLAGTGKADASSLVEAVNLAYQMATIRVQHV